MKSKKEKEENKQPHEGQERIPAEQANVMLAQQAPQMIAPRVARLLCPTSKCYKESAKPRLGRPWKNYNARHTLTGRTYQAYCRDSSACWLCRVWVSLQPMTYSRRSRRTPMSVCSALQRGLYSLAPHSNTRLPTRRL